MSTLTRINAPVLRACMSSTWLMSSRRPCGGKIDRLTTRHAEGSARLPQHLDQPQSRLGRAGSEGSQAST